MIRVVEMMIMTKILTKVQNLNSKTKLLEIDDDDDDSQVISIN